MNTNTAASGNLQRSKVHHFSCLFNPAMKSEVKGQEGCRLKLNQLKMRREKATAVRNNNSRSLKTSKLQSTTDRKTEEKKRKKAALL